MTFSRSYIASWELEADLVQQWMCPSLLPLAIDLKDVICRNFFNATAPKSNFPVELRGVW